MIPALRIVFGAIFLVMVAATVLTSLRESIFTGGSELLRLPWGVMTLLDAYFGFTTFYVWVAWKETTVTARILWFLLIMTLGNIAMSFYVLLQTFQLPAGATVADLLTKRKGRRDGA